MLIRLIARHLRPYRRWLAFLVVAQFLATLAMLFLPSMNADIIDKGVSTGDTNYIIREGGLMLLVALGQVVCSVIAAWFSARTAMSFGRDVRAGLFHRVGSFSAREMNQFGAPSLITRETNDVQQVQMLVVMGGTMLVGAPIMLVGAVVMAIRQDVGLAWLMAVLVPTLAISLGLVISKMVPSSQLMQERIDEVNRVLREQITGVRVVRAFVREGREARRFDDANAELTRVSLVAGRWLSLMFPIVMLVSNVAVVALLWFGGHAVDNGSTQVGSITAYISYLMQIVMSVMMSTFVLMMVPRAAVCATRITEVLDTESSVPPPIQPVRELTERGTLRFNNVEFAYRGAAEPVLRNISFEAHAGQTVALIGSTGAGKTTALSLIPRLFDVTDGSVLVDGVDVRDLEPEMLWSTLGYIPQKAFLFTGTIRSNMQYGKVDATDEEIWDALEIAQAKDFVSALPEGLDAQVSQGGTNFSGGQRQRLAIARAVVRKPEIYLFDDSFSALDLSTDARLRAALVPVTRDATVLVVAQRVSTIRDADLILVLEDGVIVGRGTHEELLASCPTYEEIVRSQLRAEEAA